ncbi:MAG TPA: hypothetical protein VMU51_34255 [Mycobacteriales bacterium]|nr:hypothetical protein [Mycobacteriales bacterium]
MPAPAGAYVLKNVTATFDGDEYANQLTKARLVPDTPTQTLRTLVPDGVVQDTDTPVWTLELSGIQDYVQARGLARYLTDNAGDQVEVVLTPKVGGVTATVDVILKAVPFGGDQGNFTVFEIELPVVGTPVFA